MARSILEKETFPYIGKKIISEIKTPDVLAVLRRIEDRGLIVKAHKAKDVISLVFRYAVQTGRTAMKIKGDITYPACVRVIDPGTTGGCPHERKFITRVGKRQR